MTDGDTFGIGRLLAIMAQLRDPGGGCPWDIEQDFASIAPYTIEEAYEVADAIARADWPDLRTELGDLLLQVVFHARMAEEAGHFAFADVVAAITDKLIRRHPAIFGGEVQVRTAAEQTREWERQKQAERAARNERGALDGVALGLPALLRAVKLQDRAARAGREPDATVPDGALEDVGDALFALANAARRRGIDPEAALRAANDRFTERFRAAEATKATGRQPEASDEPAGTGATRP